VDSRIAESMLHFAKMPRFRRACHQLMAWSLPVEEGNQVREAFLELDQHHTGMIKLTELKQVLEDKFNVPTEMSRSVIDAFKQLDGEHNEVIHYSDFLAAMLSSRLSLNDSLLRETFRHFDTRDCGHISPRALQSVLGKSFDVNNIFESLDANGDGQISVDELVDYLRGEDEQGVKTQSSDLSGASQRRSMSDLSTDVGGSEDDSGANDSADEVATAVGCSSGLGLRARLRRFGDGVKIGGCLNANRVQSPSARNGAPGGA